MSRDDAVAGVQALTADILMYFSEMGVSPNLLTIALQYDATDVRYLSSREMQDLGVTNWGGEASAPQAEEPAARSEPKLSREEAALEVVKMLVEGDATASLENVARWYASDISYYGKNAALADVIQDKKRYFQRWPDRQYRIRASSLRSTCSAQLCVVSGLYDWAVRSVARNKQASGLARFSYSIAIYPEPRIVSEGGEVIR